MTPYPWLRKPLWVVQQQQQQQLNQQHNTYHTNPSTTTTTTPHIIERHLSLFDLIMVGVGGTIGSGVFVLSGWVAHNAAGPATVVSFALAGVAAACSGIGYAELAGRLPATGSTYIYTYITMGELPAVLAFACMTLEYAIAGSAVARSWGDKLNTWVKEGLDMELVAMMLEPGYGINPMAGVISAVSTMVLWNGVKESKCVTNVFSMMKIVLVVFMIVGGLSLMDRSNLQPLIPMGFGGVMRGATSSFFAFLGYDEVCVVAGEALHPQHDMPRAVLWTLLIVTMLYMAATLALTGMQPYNAIDETSGFPMAFRANGALWAGRIAALGEIVTLPVVVLLSLMAQPRLQQALVQDGLLPEILGRVDESGNLRSGVLISGIIMTIVATFVPFQYLDDLISTGILVAFSMTNGCLILLRCESPTNRPDLLSQQLGMYNVLCLMTSVVISKMGWIVLGVVLCVLTFGYGWYMSWCCPRSRTFGGSIFRQINDDNHPHHHHHHHHHYHDDDDDEEEDDDDEDGDEDDGEDGYYFKTPCVPLIPCFGTFVNWYLIAQLEWSGLLLLVLYLGMTTILYFCCVKTSFDGQTGWKRTNDNHDGCNGDVRVAGVVGGVGRGRDGEDAILLRSLSLPKKEGSRRSGVGK